eukprot:CAMPEP_0204517416 /NCGR_PEP_ID=MMETSP0661-20131031/3653_1 /ASSEMBLY_ACC=CAM_ASM_000606 /TAXON_ID=109239 /ORGANISM="Alexandrium margalefi, Strain AMGDE01CS-322" /LENGTH=234 /DNA_ID=CAMNT_0051522811 /DNA_START=47 /DNA_END=751 /DNA_ORIENTATION=+
MPRLLRLLGPPSLAVAALGLRLEAGSGAARSPAGNWDLAPLRAALTGELGRILGESRFKGDGRQRPDMEPPVRIGSDQLLVTWNVSTAEPGSGAELFFRRGCQTKEQPSGHCVLPREANHNPLGLAFRTARPLDEASRLRLSVKTSSVGLTHQLSADCAVCGALCELKMPLGPSFSMNMPPCPMPEDGFRMVMPDIDLGAVPSDVAAHGVLNLALARGSGEPVAEVRADAFLTF